MLDMVMAPQMEMQANPALLNLSQLLALPTMDLQQAIQQELAENPSLEEVEAQETPCPVCGGPLIEGICLNCMQQSPGTGNDISSSSSEQETDPLLFVAAPRSLHEGLLEDLYASLPQHEHPIALTLMGSLDEQGFLADTPADIAATANVSVEQVEAVLQRLRELGPPGIATTDTRECMLAQIDLLEQEGRTCPHVRTIIEHHLDDLGAHRYKHISRELHISITEVESAQEFIQHHLWPYPAQIASSSSEPDSTRYRMPDIAIYERDDTFVVEVLNSPRRMLRINPLYRDLARESGSLDNDERAHVQEYVARTRVFLANLRQRESTLKQIGNAIVARQHDFLRHGVRHLAPMTRAEIAEELEMHESTVSRAVSDKTALLPNSTLLPLSEFFIAARSVQDVIRELIENETTPLSDHDIARLLTERGTPIARRTVAKYRTRMKILPSNLRG